MLDLDKVKVVLYDFDDTLCIHKSRRSDDDISHKFRVDVILHGKDAWKDCDINMHMKKFIEICWGRGILQGLISASSPYFSIHKCEWVEDRYGYKLKNFCTVSATAKVKTMLAIADAYNYKRDEILIIDDFWENLERAANAGFQACSPMEIVNYITDNDYRRF